MGSNMRLRFTTDIPDEIGDSTIYEDFRSCLRLKNADGRIYIFKTSEEFVDACNKSTEFNRYMYKHLKMVKNDIDALTIRLNCKGLSYEHQLNKLVNKIKTIKKSKDIMKDKKITKWIENDKLDNLYLLMDILYGYEVYNQFALDNKEDMERFRPYLIPEKVNRFFASNTDIVGYDRLCPYGMYMREYSKQNHPEEQQIREVLKNGVDDILFFSKLSPINEFLKLNKKIDNVIEQLTENVYAGIYHYEELLRADNTQA